MQYIHICQKLDPNILINLVFSLKKILNVCPHVLCETEQVGASECHTLQSKGLNKGL